MQYLSSLGKFKPIQATEGAESTSLARPEIVAKDVGPMGSLMQAGHIARATLSLAHGNILHAAKILAQPISRHTALTNYMQERILRMNQPKPPWPAMQPLSILGRPPPVIQGINQLGILPQQNGQP